MTDPATVPQTAPVPTWRKVIAAILDFLFVFIIGGYVIGYLTGNVTSEGFSLNGGPAFVLFAVLVLYFVLFTRYLGGTVFQRLLRVR